MLGNVYTNVGSRMSAIVCNHVCLCPKVGLSGVVATKLEVLGEAVGEPVCEAVGDHEVLGEAVGELVGEAAVGELVGEAV
jgi:hypothetical protein